MPRFVCQGPVDLYLAGHDHSFRRFAALGQTPLNQEEIESDFIFWQDYPFKLINEVSPKREQGPTVGHGIILAALDRALEPLSKLAIGLAISDRTNLT